MACALFLAMGKMVGSVFSAVSVLLVFGLSAALGAMAFCLVLPEGGWLWGAYSGIYGLIGGYTFLMWVTLKAQNGRPSQAFSLIAMLLAIHLVFGIIFGNTFHWVAELVGFLTGFGLSFFFMPGGLLNFSDASRCGVGFCAAQRRKMRPEHCQYRRRS